ncbi:MAG: AAA family ATPase [Polymorphobacter sp.]|uniref:AAA family ATPase n=1 Tax=Polymorphobacter sp. TaxID=1909290 RepID=UPI003A875C94
MSGISGGSASRVSIVLSPPLASSLNVDRLMLPDVSVQLHSGTLDSFAGDPARVDSTDVLVVELDPADVRGMEAFERFASQHLGRVAVVAAVQELSVSVTRRILRSDAVDVLPLPFSADELHQAVETARQVRQTPLPPPVFANAAPRRRGRVISFLGALGGVGTTSLVSQLGALWAQDKRVCLVDLDVQFGNAALYLNLRPRMTVAELVDAGDRMDGEYLASVAEKHVSGLDVVAAPTDIVPFDIITPQMVEKLIALAAENYDVVLIDLANAWTNWSAAALGVSDSIILVSELSVAGVHQAKRQLDVLEANNLTDRVRLVLNRMAVSLFRKADLSQTEQALKRKVDFVVSNDYPTMSAAIDEGRTVGAIKVKSRLEKDLRALMAGLAEIEALSS